MGKVSSEQKKESCLAGKIYLPQTTAQVVFLSPALLSFAVMLLLSTFGQRLCKGTFYCFILF